MSLKIAYHWLQLVASVILTAGLGVFNFVRCLISGSDFVYLICFGAIIYVGWYFLISTSIEELRAVKSEKSHGANR